MKQADAVQAIPLSARSVEGVVEAARRLHTHLERHGELSLENLAYTYQSARQRHEFRAVLYAREVRELAAACVNLNAGQVSRATLFNEEPRCAFIFSGQGGVFPAMGRGLMRFSAFREALRPVEDILSSGLPCPVTGLLEGSGTALELTETHVTQRVLFALQLGLSALWQSCGLRPGLVAGHSVGELAAAVCAGILDAREAAQFVVERADATARCPRGVLVSVAGDRAQVEPLLRQDPRLELALINAEDRLVVGGPAEAIEGLRRDAGARGLTVKPIAMSHAFHTRAMEGAVAPLRVAAARLSRRESTVPLVRNRDGARVSTLDAEHLATAAAAPVDFAATARTVREWTPELLVEIGPGNGTLQLLARGGVRAAAQLASVVSQEAPEDTLCRGLGTMFLTGLPVSFERLHEGRAPRKVHIPATPLERRSVGERVSPTPATPGGTPRKEAPALPLEQAAHEAWAAVLGRAPSPQSDFFLDGGDSLAAIQLLTRLQPYLAAPLGFDRLFELRTFGALCEVLRQNARGGQAGIERVQTAPHYAVSPFQERLYLLSRLPGQESAYNLEALVPVDFERSPERLADALRKVVRHHDALRLTFHFHDDTVRAALHEELAPVIETVDAPGPQSDPSARNHIAGLLRERWRAPFDLEHGPLCRAVIVRWPEGELLLFLVVHHLVFDGHSMNTLLRDLRRFCQGEPAGEPPAVRWIDVAAWLAQPGRSAQSLEYFRGAIDPRRSHVELPAAFARPAVLDLRAGRARRLVETETAEALKALCRAEGATLFMGLLTAYSRLLGELASSTDVTIGTPVVARSSPELTGVIGPLINTVPLRLRSSPEQTWKQRLSSTREATLAAFRHQDVDFGELVSALRVERRADRPPLLNTWFALQTVVENAQHGARLREEFGLDPELCRFELMLVALESPGGLRLELEYARSLFDSVQVERWLHRLAELLRELARAPDQPPPLAAGPGAPPRRLQGPVVPATWSLTSQIEAVVTAHPEQVAVEHGPARITYGTLWAVATRLAHQFEAAGVRAGDRVALAVPRSGGFLAAALATWRLGAAYIPIDPEWPEERKAYVLGDSTPRVTVMPRTTGSAWKGAVLELPPDEELHALASSGTGQSFPVSPADPAYIIYTSGSTGRPKGVVVHHGGLVNYLDHCRRTYLSTGGRGAVLHSSLAYDMSVTSLWLPLLEAEPVVVVDGQGAEALEGLCRLVTTRRLRLLKLTPTHIDAMAEALGAGAAPLADVLVVGGEQLYTQQVRGWKAASPTLRIFNEYGPTEASVGCVVHEVSGSEGDGPVPIGLPIQNVELELKEVGGDAELWIGGVAVARGYLNRPELTQARFQQDPISGRSWYATGDHVRVLPEGVLEFIGRRDDQVKIRGHRIELGEIDAALQSLEGLAQAAAQVRDGSIIAHVTARDPALRARDIVEALRARLPEFALPSEVHFWPELPRTANGKLDREALLRPPAASATGEGPAPADGDEAAVLEAFRGVLKRREIGVEDSFFEWGGNSLKLFAVLLRLQPRFPRLELQTFFQAPSARQLVQRLRAEHPPAVTPPPSEPALSRPAPASTLPQQREASARILVTGATGFLGIHVVKELLTRPDTRVACLVRGRDEAEARGRFDALWRHYFGATEASGRIQILPGDVITPSLVPTAQAGALEQLTGIIHTAADVRHFGEASAVEAVNLGGTRHILALAQRTGARLIHVSTPSVLNRRPQERGELVLHEDDTEHLLDGSENIYVRTKLAAERVVTAWDGARVVRTGNLVPAWPQGRFRLDIERSAFFRMLRSWLLTAVAPDRFPGGALLDLTPVDFAARAVVSAFTAEGPRRIFHALHPDTFALGELGSVLRGMGYPLEVLPRSQYLLHLRQRFETGDLSEGLELAALHLNSSQATETEDSSTLRYDARRTLEALGLKAEVRAEPLIRHVVEAGIAAGYLPPPRARGAP
ncbi:MAG TPA: amino acid adenylation domain-containing protein [Myxococcaceae bacterium]